jgi:hypothetical protein
MDLDCIGYIPAPREGHAAAIVDDVMYIFGGRTEGGADLGDLAAFRISSRGWFTFQNMGPSPSPRSGHSMTVYGKKVVVLGGEPSSAVGHREPQDLAIVYLLDTSKIRYPNDWNIQQVQEIQSKGRITADRSGGAGEQSGQNNLRSAENLGVVPFSDSGYASTLHDKVEGKQSARIENHAQSTNNLQSQISMDDGYNNTTEPAQNSDDAATEDNRTVYSDASSLADLKYESYISEFADDLFSKFRYEKFDNQTMQRISGVLTRLLKAFALRVGHNAPSQMHRDVMFFIHKYRR